MSAPESSTGGGTAIRPFEVGFDESELADLRRRIAATRWPERETVDDDSQGIRLATMQDLARYWATDYDWRSCEKKLNSLPNFLTEIDGLDIHFIHVRSRHEDALPLIVTHGWPGSIIEQLKIIEPLTDPTSYGGTEADAFHLVIPSLPGHGFSGKPTATGWDPARVARAWVGADESPRIHRVRGPGRRLGCGRHADDGHPGASGLARHPLQHARHGPGRRRQGVRARRPAAGRALGRGAARIRAAERLLHQARGLRADHVDPPADAVRVRGLTHRSRRVRARPRRRDRPARPGAEGPRGNAARATSPETTSSTTSRSTG